MDDINIIFAYKDISRAGSDMVWCQLECAANLCAKCSCQKGLLRESPVCGTPANRCGRICAHSYACSDFAGTQHSSGRYYVSSILVNQKELIGLAVDIGYPEDDYI